MKRGLNFFGQQPVKNYTLIVGCGSLGAGIARNLSNQGKDVQILDKNAQSFRRLSGSYGGLSTVADGTDLDALREANIRSATTVLAVTDSDSTNLMIAQMAKELFGVPKVVARVYDTEREAAFRDAGVDMICPAALSAKEADKYLEE